MKSIFKKHLKFTNVFVSFVLISLLGKTEISKAQCTPDIAPPTIVFNNNLTKNLSSSGSISLSVSDVENGSSDNCTASGSLSKKLTFGSQTNVGAVNFSCTDIGAQNVTYSVTDGAGNSSSVTVKITISDNLAPTITFNNNITKNLNSSGTVSLSVSDVEIGSSDNCTAPGTLTKKLTFGSQTNVSTVNFSCTDLGAQNITYTVTDGAGNASSVTVKVTIADNLGPNIIFNNNLTKNLSSSGAVSLSISEIENGSTDNCSASASLVKKLSFGSQSNVNTINFNCIDIGSQNVTYTVTDAIGNISSVTVKVTIVDNISPTIVFNNNFTKNLNASGAATLLVSEVENGSTDNCSITKKLTFNAQNSSTGINFSCSDLGVQNITYSVTDAYGNTSTAIVKVTIVDNVTPTIAFNNITKYLNNSGTISVTPSDFDNGSTDNCTMIKKMTLGSQINVNSLTFSCSDIATVQNITYTVSDAGGNSANTTVKITIADNLGPTIVYNNNLTKNLSSAGAVSLSTTEIENGSTDNCTASGSLVKKLSYGAQTNVNTINFSCTDVGSQRS